MKPRVVVIDYGIGNLHSVTKALAHVGAEVDMTSDADIVAAADRVVLPGVGAFSDGMRELETRGLTAVLRDHARAGKPLLGICLGMQMLMEESEEFGAHRGLGIVAGAVRRLPNSKTKVPHIGWSRISPASPDAWRGSVLESVDRGAHVYFVHSFHVTPSRNDITIATCAQPDEHITAAIRVDNVTGLQFHPEKSGPVGLEMLHTFCRN
jgi:glutamine amidotransferase